jgi:hypothetical protein
MPSDPRRAIRKTKSQNVNVESLEGRSLPSTFVGPVEQMQPAFPGTVSVTIGRPHDSLMSLEGDLKFAAFSHRDPFFAGQVPNGLWPPDPSGRGPGPFDSGFGTWPSLSGGQDGGLTASASASEAASQRQTITAQDYSGSGKDNPNPMDGLAGTDLLVFRGPDLSAEWLLGGSHDLSALSIAPSMPMGRVEIQPLPPNALVLFRQLAAAPVVGMPPLTGLPTVPFPIGPVHQSNDHVLPSGASDGESTLASGIPLGRNPILTAGTASPWRVGMSIVSPTSPTFVGESLGLVGAPRRVVQRPALDPPADTVDGETAVPDELPTSPSFGAGLHDRFSPFDRSTLEQALDRFLDQLGEIDEELYHLGEPGNLIPQVIAAATALSIAEALRRRTGRRWEEAVVVVGDDEASFASQPGLPGRWDSEES